MSVIVVPGAPRITRGPYRLMPHPNYVAVVLEGIALMFTALNAELLRTRIKVENGALVRLS